MDNPQEMLIRLCTGEPLEKRTEMAIKAFDRLIEQGPKIMSHYTRDEVLAYNHALRMVNIILDHHFAPEIIAYNEKIRQGNGGK